MYLHICVLTYGCMCVCLWLHVYTYECVYTRNYACTHEMLSYIKRDNLNPNNYPDKLNFKLKKRTIYLKKRKQ